MAALTLVTKLTKKTSKHAIPVSCPDCRADLREAGSILEQGWKPYSRYFSIDPDDDSELCADSEAVIGEGLDEEEDMATRYLCEHCKTRLDRPSARRR